MWRERGGALATDNAFFIVGSRDDEIVVGCRPYAGLMAYRVFKAILSPILRLLFKVRVEGVEQCARGRARHPRGQPFELL